jgi:hypothetical protein
MMVSSGGKGQSKERSVSSKNMRFSVVTLGCLAVSTSHGFTSLPPTTTGRSINTLLLHVKSTWNDATLAEKLTVKLASSSDGSKTVDTSSVEGFLKNLDVDTLSAPPVVVALQTFWNQVSLQLEEIRKIITDDFDANWKDSLPQVVSRFTESFETLLQHLPVIDTPETILLSSLVSFWILSNILNWTESPPPSNPYPTGVYDPLSSQIYFDARPWQVLQRAAFVAVKSLGFALDLLRDRLTQKWQHNMERRGMQLASLLTQLGPTFIKIGQSLSIRTDILPPPYVRGLTSLQDKVPEFTNEIAFGIMEEQWGVDTIYDVLRDISRPVAAASLGQVYRATLRDGTQVAVKVQRPDIQTQIALDMYLLRETAAPARRIFNLNTDTVGTVDAWGYGFVNELNYLQEADNARYFMEQIADTPLRDVVFAPAVVDEYTTSRVLVTEWIDGERLDRSSKDDITILCSICMNTYLTMLLESGLLHCDPHPGNLLRTPDGRLCILDWGMVTNIPPGTNTRRKKCCVSGFRLTPLSLSLTFHP